MKAVLIVLALTLALATACAPPSTPPRSTTTTTAWERICGPTPDGGWECR